MLHKKRLCKKGRHIYRKTGLSVFSIRSGLIFRENGLSPLGKTLAAVVSVMLVLALVPTAAFAAAGNAVGEAEPETDETAVLADSTSGEVQLDVEENATQELEQERTELTDSAITSSDGSEDTLDASANDPVQPTDADLNSNTDDDWNIFGGCKWQIDNAGKFTIKPGEATQEYASGQLPDYYS